MTPTPGERADDCGGAKALAVFHGCGAGALARLFGRPGFRHCFAAVADGDYWIEIDGRAGRPVLAVVAASAFDLARHYREAGCTVVEMAMAANADGGRHARWPWMAATCVGATKKVLGVGAPWVLTPWQLHRYLARGAGS